MSIFMHICTYECSSVLVYELYFRTGYALSNCSWWCQNDLWFVNIAECCFWWELYHDVSWLLSMIKISSECSYGHHNSVMRLGFAVNFMHVLNCKSAWWDIHGWVKVSFIWRKIHLSWIQKHK